jgi:hypothetical protein
VVIEYGEVCVCNRTEYILVEQDPVYESTPTTKIRHGAPVSHEEVVLKMLRGAWENDFDNIPSKQVVEIALRFDQAVVTITMLATHMVEYPAGAPVDVFDMIADKAREISGPAPFHKWLNAEVKKTGRPELDPNYVAIAVWKYCRLSKHDYDAAGSDRDARAPVAFRGGVKLCCANSGKPIGRNGELAPKHVRINSKHCLNNLDPTKKRKPKRKPASGWDKPTPKNPAKKVKE